MAPTNVCMPFYEPGGRLTIKATAAITGKRFIAPSANRDAGPALNTSVGGGNIKAAHAGAGLRALGVAEYDIASGALGGCLCTPGMIVPVTAEGAIAAGAEVEVGTAGKAKSVGTGKVVGLAVSGAADGEDAQIRIL